MQSGLSHLAMEKLLKKSGLRVSESAKEELKKAIEAELATVTQNAAQYAKHAKRRTIKAQDVKMALKAKN